MKLKSTIIVLLIFVATLLISSISFVEEAKAQACICSACSWTCSNINCIGRQAGSWCASGNVKKTCSGSCVTSALCGYCVIRCGFSQKDCDDDDGIYETGNTRWVSTGACTEKKQKEVRYIDYSCSGSNCVGSEDPKYWVDTGDNRCKSYGTDCGTDVSCTYTSCSADKCDKSGTGKDYRCESGTYPSCPCNWITTTCSDPCSYGRVCSGGTCSIGTCASTNYECDTPPPNDSGICDGHKTIYQCDGSGNCDGSNYDDDSACSGLTCDDTETSCTTHTDGICEGRKRTYKCDASGNCNGSNSDYDQACDGLTCDTTDYFCNSSTCEGTKRTYKCDASGNCNGSDSDYDQACDGASCGTKSNPACPEKTCTRDCDGSGNCGDCTPPACDCTCPGWTTRSCGYSTCSWYKKGYTRTCTPSGCDTEFKCVCKESCCTAWTDQGCGQGSCAEDQMYEIRDCGTCAYLESQCVSDPSCGTTGCNLNKTGNYTVDYSCILDGAHYLQSGNLTITTGGYIQMNPGSSITFDSGYEIRIEGSGYILKSASGAEIRKE